MLTKLLFMGHILGCFWYSVSMLSEDKRGDDTWRHVYANGEAARPDVGAGVDVRRGDVDEFGGALDFGRFDDDFHRPLYGGAVRTIQSGLVRCC